jgi:hypothetical protein
MASFADEMEKEEGNKPSSVPQLSKLGEQYLALEADINALTEALKAKNSELHFLRSQTLPDAMAEAQLTSFALDDGTSFSVDDFVAGSFPKDQEKKIVAVDELKKAGGEGLLRGQLSVTFAVSQHNEGLAIADDIRKKGYDVTFESTVHAQTLQAFVREKLRSGAKVNYEALGCFVGRLAKGKAPSKKKVATKKAASSAPTKAAPKKKGK